MTEKHIPFVVKDSGKRINYQSGMRRDTQEGKPDYTLIHIPFLTRIANHLGLGLIKYGRDNWKCANSEEELQRFKGSALRHLLQWEAGDIDEDHMAAVCFNLMAAEYVKDRLAEQAQNEIDSRQAMEDYIESRSYPPIMTMNEVVDNLDENSKGLSVNLEEPQKAEKFDPTGKGKLRRLVEYLKGVHSGF